MKDLKVKNGYSESNFSNVSYLAKAFSKKSTLEDLNLLNNRITCTELFNLYEDLIQLKQNEKSNNNSVISATNRNNKSDSDVMNFPPPQIINLKRLVLAKNYLSTYPEDENKYPRVIGELLKMSHKLVYLDLSKCGISIKHLETIGDALTPKYTLPLKTLLLQKNNIGKHGLKPLVSALQHNTCLETLDISGNDIGVVGCDLLSQIMERNTGIKTLNLFGNFIEIEGCNLLCKALKQNTTLTSLDLGLNRIRVRGAIRTIAKAITIDNPNSIIQYIALAGNYLSTPKRSDISLLLNSVKERAMCFDLAKLVEVKDVKLLVIKNLFFKLTELLNNNGFVKLRRLTTIIQFV
ncbi:hypothetical protein ABK040_016025 [Willaertia magna]